MMTARFRRLGLCLSALCVVGLGACTTTSVEVHCPPGPVEVGDLVWLSASKGSDSDFSIDTSTSTWFLESSDGAVFGVCGVPPCTQQDSPGGSSEGSGGSGVYVRADQSGTVKVWFSAGFDCEASCGRKTATCEFRIVEVGEGDSGGDNNAGGGDPCQPLAYFWGAWTSVYQCTNTCGLSFGGEFEVAIQQNGDRASYQDGDAVFSGTVCGDVWSFARVDAGHPEEETGTLTLNPDGTATRESTWQSVEPTPENVFCSGHCTDTFTRAAPP